MIKTESLNFNKPPRFRLLEHLQATYKLSGIQNGQSQLLKASSTMYGSKNGLSELLYLHSGQMDSRNICKTPTAKLYKPLTLRWSKWTRRTSTRLLHPLHSSKQTLLILSMLIHVLWWSKGTLQTSTSQNLGFAAFITYFPIFLHTLQWSPFKIQD